MVQEVIHHFNHIYEGKKRQHDHQTRPQESLYVR